MDMRVRTAVSIGVMAMLASSALLSAQAGAPSAPSAPTAAAPSAVPDLSGDWAMTLTNVQHGGGIGQSLSGVDPGGFLRGKEPDIPYLPKALTKTLSEVPPTGPDGKYETTTDPNIHFCEPLGLGRVYMAPAKTRFVQTPEAVYLLHEMGPTFRVVWLNATHPDDPDPQYWGHSIGHYENGDTLVVDTVGVNDRSWLDQLGHPHGEQLHFIERYTRVGNTIQIDFTVDDPEWYSAPWAGHRVLEKSSTGFMRFMWVCSVRDNNHHYDATSKDANSGDTTFK
jgi:hypothetical protein